MSLTVLALYTKKRELLKTPTKIEDIQTCKIFLWREYAVDRSTDP
jgi:hypothetical protein